MSRPIAFALAALLTTAGAASAENTFVLDRARSTPSSLAITNVQADAAGTIEVYAYDDGDLVRFLGAAPIQPGNTAAVDVLISPPTANKGALDQPTGDDLLVVLMNDNYSVARLVTDAPLSN